MSNNLVVFFVVLSVVVFFGILVYFFKLVVDLAMENFEAKMKNLMQAHFESLNEQTKKKLDEIEKDSFRNKQELADVFKQAKRALENLTSVIEHKLKKSQEIISIVNKQNIRKSRKIAKLEEEISKLKRD